MGFVLSDRNLRRSAMDYWPRLQLTIHDDDLSFQSHLQSQLQEHPRSRAWFFTSKSQRTLWDVDQVAFSPVDWLIFGSETSGLATALLDEHPSTTVRIPQVAGERCLNLATAAGIALYEALRQVNAAAHIIR
jgi:tRNA (cytidine/uridine-2'-O-)-methyltransferase